MDQKQFEAVLNDAESRIKQLKTLYEQWFAGIERLEPTQKRKEVETILRELRAEPTRNTALKFRVGQLQQRYNSFKTYWMRVARQIEEGTYKRDILRAQRIKADPAVSEREQLQRPDAYELDADLDIEDALKDLRDVWVARRNSKPVPPGDITPFAQPVPGGAAAPRRSVAGTAARAASSAEGGRRTGDLSDAQMQDIFNRYVAARQKNAERTDNVKLEKLAQSVRGMMPKLAKKHAGKKIDFEVVVKDGKVALKPVAK